MDDGLWIWRCCQKSRASYTPLCNKCVLMHEIDENLWNSLRPFTFRGNRKVWGEKTRNLPLNEPSGNTMVSGFVYFTILSPPPLGGPFWLYQVPPPSAPKFSWSFAVLLGVPYISGNIYCKSRNLLNICYICCASGLEIQKKGLCSNSL